MYRFYRWYRSAALAVFFLLVGAPVWSADLCAFPGRDGDRQLKGEVNRWIPSPDNLVLEPGTRRIMVAEDWRGRGALQSGDVLLLIQMQGAELSSDNSTVYGSGDELDGSGRGQTALHAGHFEFLRLESSDGLTLQVRGDGLNGGLVNRYVSRLPDKAAGPGASRWQLVRVPQFENLRLVEDIVAVPWDGRSGGVLAIDVRRQLDLNGYRLGAAATGFRGGGALPLQGALGDRRDYRYRAPATNELAVGFGQHGSKGEGLAGTPRWLASDGSDGAATAKAVDGLPRADKMSLSDGYPSGSMARGAPANAGGGGSGLNSDNSDPSGGGGGAGGENGFTGQDTQGRSEGGLGGQAVSPFRPLLTAGGGGGAGSKHSGAGGHGGRGGGIIVIRAGHLIGPGRLDVSGANGTDGEQSGGGGGAGGTLWVQAALAGDDDIGVILNSGSGGKAPASGGGGGAGRLLYGGGIEFLKVDQGLVNDRLSRASAPGAAPGYVCRPTGMLIAGNVFEDNGVNGGTAHDGRRQRNESSVEGWPVVVMNDSGDVLASTRTSHSGQFALELPEALKGQALHLKIPIEEGWHPVVARSNDLPLAPFRYVAPGHWQFTGQREYLQDGLVLGLVRQAEMEEPDVRTVKQGSTQVFPFKYTPHTTARVRFQYRGELSHAPAWQHAFFLDTNCDQASDYVGEGMTGWVPVHAGVPVCVRVRVDVPENTTDSSAFSVRIDVESDLGTNPLSLKLPPLKSAIRISLDPRK